MAIPVAKEADYQIDFSIFSKHSKSPSVLPKKSQTDALHTCQQTIQRMDSSGFVKMAWLQISLPPRGNWMCLSFDLSCQLSRFVMYVIDRLEETREYRQFVELCQEELVLTITKIH